MNEYAGTQTIEESNSQYNDGAMKQLDERPSAQSENWDAGADQGLTGRYFHGINPNNPNNHWAGKIIGHEQQGYYLVHTRYNNGKPDCYHSVFISDMRTWEFYDTEEQLMEGQRFYAEIAKSQLQQSSPSYQEKAYSASESNY